MPTCLIAYSFVISAPQTDQVDVSGVKPGVLSNAGLLMCRLLCGDRYEVATVNMVVQVKKEGDCYMREIISPLD